MALFLAVIGASASSDDQHCRIFVAFAFMLLLLVLIARYRSKANKSMQAQAAASTPTASGAFAMSASPASISYERLLMLRRPRAIRLKTLNGIFTAASIIAFIGVGYALFVIVDKGGANANSSALPSVIPFAMFGLIWSIMAITMFRSMLRDRSLLSDGEISVATVTSQSFAGCESRNSRITNEFKDAAGRTFSGKCRDHTRKVFEEMQTPVFYDSTNPARNIALVGATYDLVES